MGIKWQLQEAKNKLSGLIEKVEKEGPQIITKHGKDTAVIISVTEYDKLMKPDKDIVQFFKDSPLFGHDIEAKRDKSPVREITL